MNNAGRAALALEREHLRFQKHPVWGIEARPLSYDNMFIWRARIRGLKGTLWEDGYFHLKIRYSEHYDVQPPDVCFHTIPFHPNINPVTGQPCIEFLDDFMQWREDFSITGILMSIQAVLSNPTVTNPVHPAAAALYKKNPEAYDQIVRECVQNSLKYDSVVSEGAPTSPTELDMRPVSLTESPAPRPLSLSDGQDPRLADRRHPPLKDGVFGRENAGKAKSEDDYSETTSMESFYAPAPPVKQTSFDDYRKHWIQLATTMDERNAKSHMKDLLRGDVLATGLPSSQQQRRLAGNNTPALESNKRQSRPKRPREAQLAAELRKNADLIRQKHNNTYYGIINSQCVLPDRNVPKPEETVYSDSVITSKQHRSGLGTNAIRRVQFTSRTDKHAMSVSITSTADVADDDDDEEEEEPWEREVDDLVSWTKKLTTNGL